MSQVEVVHGDTAKIPFGMGTYGSRSLAVGGSAMVKAMDKIIAKQDHAQNITLVRDLSDTMLNGSLCALGGMTPYPVLSAMNHFPEDFGLEKGQVA